MTYWTYTDRNLVSTVYYEDKHVLTNTHDAAYRLTNQTLGNGLTRTINYGRQDNLRTTDKTFDGAQTLDDLNLSYTYAADKQITAENIVGDAVQNTSFTAAYDAGNRLTAWQMPLASASTRQQTWNYDDAGNWQSTTKTIGNTATTETRNHSVSDQITSIAGNAATHDAKGNLTNYEINTKQYEVEYDLDNRIIKVDVNNTDVEYRYDALGRRVIRQEGSTKTALIWWGNSENAEYVHSAGQSCIQNDIMSHPSALNSVIARAVDGSKFDLEWYHKNYLDHVYAVSDDGGDLNEHYRYTAFGEVTIYNGSGTIQSSTQINNTITWNTRRLDPVSGYYIYKYRHYDPALGRWPSRDPIEEGGGVNLYVFVGNYPIGRWDRLGLIEVTGAISKAEKIKPDWIGDNPYGLIAGNVEATSGKMSPVKKDVTFTCELGFGLGVTNTIKAELNLELKIKLYARYQLLEGETFSKIYGHEQMHAQLYQHAAEKIKKEIEALEIASHEATEEKAENLTIEYKAKLETELLKIRGHSDEGEWQGEGEDLRPTKDELADPLPGSEPLPQNPAFPKIDQPIPGAPKLPEIPANTLK